MRPALLPRACRLGRCAGYPRALFAVLALAIVAPVLAFAGTYTENFTTTNYRDATNTTADWNTVDGELKLFPLTFTTIGSYDTPGEASGVVVSGDLAFVADGSFGLQVIDITDPAAPALVSTFFTSGAALDVAVSGDLAFVTDLAAGLLLVDVTTPSAPTLVGTYPAAFATSVVVSGDMAYLVDAGGLHLIDISDPGNPAHLGLFLSIASDVAVSGNLAYLVGSGLEVIDVSDPTVPTLVGIHPVSGLARGVAVSGNLAFVAKAFAGLEIVDVTNPAAPAFVGDTGALGGYAEDVFVSGDLVLVADDANGLQGIDVTDPTSPVLAGSYDTPGAAIGVVVAGDKAFVADGVGGLRVIDFARPVLLGATCTNRETVELTFSEALGAPGITDVGNYTFDPPATVISASVGSTPAKVVLQTSWLEAGQIYQVTAVNLQDAVGKPLTPPNNRASLRCATSLWDQSDYAATATRSHGYFSYTYTPAGGFPSESQVGDTVANYVSFARPVVITGMTNYMKFLTYSPDLPLEQVGQPSPVGAGPVEAFMYLRSATSGDPTSDLGLDYSGTIVSVTLSPVGDVYEVEATGLNIALEPGDYWIGLQPSFGYLGDTPIARPYHMYSQRFIPPSFAIGSNTALFFPWTSALATTNPAIRIDGYELGVDCNGNGTPDIVEIEADWSLDCNSNGFLDSCELNGLSTFGQLPLSGFSYGVSTDGTYAFVNNGGENRVDVVDVTNPAYPSVIASIALAGRPFYSLRVDDYLYVAAYDTGLYVVDVSDVSNPVQVGHLPSPNHILRPAHRGDHLYLAAENNDFQVVSIADRENPTVVGILATPDDPKAVVLAGDYAFVAAHYNGMYVIDISEPTTPILAGQVDTPDKGDGIARLGENHVVVADLSSLQIIDVSIPTSPFVVSTVPSLTNARNVEVDGDVVYVTTLDGLLAYDMSDPLLPVLMDQLVLPAEPYQTALVQGRLVVANASNGVVVTNPMAVDKNGDSIPDECQEATAAPPVAANLHMLHPAIPNPFNPSTTIRFDLPRAGNVELTIYDMAGRRVRTLVREARTAGRHEVVWRGEDRNSRRVASGVYLYRLSSGSYVETRRMTLLK